MIVYRLSRTRHARDLSGEGARLYGGRWNFKGTPCLYTSESRALSALEYTVNIGIDDIPRALSMVAISIPVKEIKEIPVHELPGNWNATPAPISTKNMGTFWLQNMTSLALKIPSSVIPEEFNILVNPRHPLAEDIRIVDIRDFVYDVRIKLA
ncbi:MAG: RES family NAD+ phosphorylase [Dinghuibacter sp.]|nr:RES family NAD+ phosphorylase [Dinghuibacter sp.]